jgi:predicted ATPase/class 3 adenylate cyclase
MQSQGGNVTFLFTDIERSSQLWEQHPEAMSRALARHDQSLTTLFLEHRGHVFKTLGDAFCVAFGNAPDAVRAALATQHLLAEAAWEETGPLRVRIALHSGEAEQRNGDYFGQTLNRTARLLAAGHGGQTLLSRVTAERVREELPAEISLLDLGERRLKDLSRPERIFQLAAPGLPSEFPPLRSLEVLPNNLPAQVTAFIGRAGGVAEVTRLLDGTRLLTLTGPGGTGKTRLSLQVAAEVLDRFPHGIWLVELATLSDPGRVPEAIAGAIDIRGEADRPPLDTLISALRSRQLLIVLDNCEHLIGACAETASALLRCCPELKILASSREPLGIAGESIWGVPSLAVPDFSRDEQEPSFEEIESLEAVQLFVDRAKAVRPDFALTPRNAPVVAKICWRLDGIPLAIELAAARVKVLTPEQILTRLDNRFQLLSGGSRTALPRQQTLGALIDWSYDLLSEPERVLLRRLSVFVAGRTLDAVEEVCDGDGLERVAIFDLLCALVDKSLVMVEPGPDGETRYTMLESIWDYAEEKLAHHGETERYRNRHLDYFMRLAGETEPHLTGPNQTAWLEKLGIEHFNLNFALRWSLESGDRIERGLRLAGALARYWEVRNYLTEGWMLYEELLGRANETTAPGILAKAEAGAGRLYWCKDRDDDALRHYDAARLIYEKLACTADAAHIRAMSGFAERNKGNNSVAREHFEHALQTGEAEHSVRIEATALSGLGSIAADEGDLPLARDLKMRSLEKFRALGDKWILGVVAWSVGKVLVALDEHEEARRFLNESLALARELGNKWSLPYALEAIGDICGKEQNAMKAIQLYAAAGALREALGLAFSPAEKNAHEAAIRHLRESVSPAIFEAEWEAGKSLALDGAVRLALDAEVGVSMPH